MAENNFYNSSEMESINHHRQTVDMFDDLTISTNNSALIFNLCNEMAKKIKDQAVNVIGHVAINTSSKV